MVVVAIKMKNLVIVKKIQTFKKKILKKSYYYDKIKVNSIIIDIIDY